MKSFGAVFAKMVNRTVNVNWIRAEKRYLPVLSSEWQDTLEVAVKLGINQGSANNTLNELWRRGLIEKRAVRFRRPDMTFASRKMQWRRIIPVL